MSDGDIDYSHYGEQSLVQAFRTINGDRYPINFERLKARLETLGYSVKRSGDTHELVPPDPPRQANNAPISLENSQGNPDGEARIHAASVFLVISIGLMLFGYIRYKTRSGDFGPIAEMFITWSLAVIPGLIGIRLALKGARTAPRSWVNGLMVILALVVAIVILWFCLLVLGVLIS